MAKHRSTIDRHPFCPWELFAYGMCLNCMYKIAQRHLDFPLGAVLLLFLFRQSANSSIAQEERLICTYFD